MSDEDSLLPDFLQRAATSYFVFVLERKNQKRYGNEVGKRIVITPVLPDEVIPPGTITFQTNPFFNQAPYHFTPIELYDKGNGMKKETYCFREARTWKFHAWVVLEKGQSPLRLKKVIECSGANCGATLFKYCGWIQRTETLSFGEEKNIRGKVRCDYPGCMKYHCKFCDQFRTQSTWMCSEHYMFNDPVEGDMLDLDTPVVYGGEKQ